MEKKLTTLYPMVQFRPDTWEIDEFDVASMFLLIGTKRALLIDCGMGIGDLKTAVEGITDKPVTLAITHAHLDHTGNIRQFSDVYIHPDGMDEPMPGDFARRKKDTECIAIREKGRYPYDLSFDLREDYGPMPELKPLYDGWSIDLGDRTVRAFECFGHGKGAMVFLDERERILLCGDALNYNLGLGATSIETALRGLERMQAHADSYDGIYNGHHDFRPLGAPLGDNCLPTVIEICRELLAGTADTRMVPSFWGPAAGRPDRLMAVKGKNFVGFDPEKIFDSQVK